MKKEYQSWNHAKCHIRYHVIFSTKYRRKCLCGIEDLVKSVMYGISARCKFKLVEVGIDKDHIHFLIKAAPSVAISQIVRRLKQISTRELWAQAPEHFKRYYWGNKKLVWTNGYFCSTIGEVSESKAMGCIKNQG